MTTFFNPKIIQILIYIYKTRNTIKHSCISGSVLYLMTMSTDTEVLPGLLFKNWFFSFMSENHELC